MCERVAKGLVNYNGLGTKFLEPVLIVSVLGHIELDRTLSTQELETVSDISRTSIQHISKLRFFSTYFFGMNECSLLK